MTVFRLRKLLKNHKSTKVSTHFLLLSLTYYLIWFNLQHFVFSVDVHIMVKDVNEYIPEWSQEEYSGQVEEETMEENIVKVQARDKDCSPSFGEICQYSITSPEQPFSISTEGIIRNSAPLSATESRSHVLSVVATDCGGKESSPVLVTITVLPRCTTSWSGTVILI